jgi:hypothetical protein
VGYGFVGILGTFKKLDNNVTLTFPFISIFTKFVQILRFCYNNMEVMNMFELTKLARWYKEARSVDARRNKQYRKMLDSLEGGKGIWEEKLKTTGERSWPGIYHGASNENAVQSIKNEGLRASNAPEFSKAPAVFFGTKNYAQRYSKGMNEFVDKKTGKRTQIISSPQNNDGVINLSSVNASLFNDQKAFANAYPELANRYDFNTAPLFRFKTPKELKGTTLSYPKSDAQVFAVNPNATYENMEKELRNINAMVPYPEFFEDYSLHNRPNHGHHIRRYGVIGDTRIFDLKQHRGRREMHINENIPQELLTLER